MGNVKVFEKSFFQKPTLDIAPALLGQVLCRQLPDGSTCRLKINEVEAYDGFEDKASHAHKGKTQRNAIMFEEGGSWYVYLCYGVHWMLNIVTGPKDYPAAILLRGAGKFDGPGKLTRALQIDKSLNTLVANKNSGLWIEESLPAQDFQQTPRIGVSYAGPVWSTKPYRFLLT